MAQVPLFSESPKTEDSVELSEIESLCTNCEQNGTTRLLLTKIPMFREVILMSFSCPHCGNKNSEIQPGAPIQDFGVRYSFSVNRKESLGRLVVKADSALVKIPELSFEIPPNTQRGVITTVEGLLSRSVSDLLKEQPNRQAMNPDLAAKIEEFIAKLQECLKCTSPFTIVLDDPSGNSFIENPLAPDVDPFLSVDHYSRTSEQEVQLGIVNDSTDTKVDTASNSNKKNDSEVGTKDEVMVFHTNCPSCNSPADTRMKLVDIPHFKEVIIMATTCDYCGCKTNEVKSGAGISKTGIRISLKLTDPNDLSRDILKAETASFAIPELEFQLEPGTLGGKFSTIEGLLQQMKEQLKRVHPFSTGDSSTGSKLLMFLNKLDEVIEGKLLNIHIILDDPAGNSYIQNTFAPDQDPEMSIEHYERTFEQNELLGLNDMNTDTVID